MCSPSNVGENLTTVPEMCSTTALSEPAKANRHNNVGLPLRMAIHNLELKIISGSTSINKLNPTANNKLRIPMFKIEMPIEVKLHTTLPECTVPGAVPPPHNCDIETNTIALRRCIDGSEGVEPNGTCVPFAL